MLYDREFKRWVFSEESVISSEERENLIYDYNEFRKEMLHTDIRDINHELYGAPRRPENESTAAKIRNVAVTVLVLGALVCCVLALLMHNIFLFGIFFCSFFFMAGAILAFTGQTNAKDTPTRKERGRVTGVFIMLGSGAILSLILLHDRFSQGELIVWIASAAFGLSGLCLVCLSIIDKLSAKIFYKEEIDAKCIGYVRMVDTESDNEGPPMTVMYISPVFEYSYEGQRIEALYDVMEIGSSSNIGLGSYTTIRINPDHPEDVMSPRVTKTSNFIALLIFGLIFVVIGSGLAWYSLLGNAKDLTVETSWNQIISGGETETTPSKKVVYDEFIEENYASDIAGKEWYREETTVSNVEDYQGNMLLTFDDTFEKMLIKPSDSVKKGCRIVIFYTVSREKEEQKKAYKQPFVYTLPDEVEYTGDRGAYKP